MSLAESVPQDVPDARIQFNNSPVLISVRRRVPWRTMTMCLILSRFFRSQARVDHLHLLTWALETEGTRALFRVWMSGQRPMDRSTVRVDPELNVTITLGHGLGLVDVTGSRKVALTAQGKDLVQEIDAQENVLDVEKAYLESLGSLSEARLRTLFKALAQ